MYHNVIDHSPLAAFRRRYTINKQKYLAELTKLLGFMSTADRAAAIRKYSAMLDAAEDEAALMDELGTPTRLAISLARSYVPGTMQEEDGEPSESVPEAPAGEPETAIEAPAEEPEAAIEAPVETQDAPEEESGPVFGEGAELDEEQTRALEPVPAEDEPVSLPEPVPEPEPQPVQDEQDAPRRTLRGGGAVLAVYTVFAIIIGLPVAVVLIAVGLPFLLLGAGVIAAAAYSVVTVVPMLGMFSDILLVSGAGLVFCAAGLVIAWLGAWISISLGSAWIGGAVLRLGRRLCWKEAR